ncbi:NIPSNAP family protein [Metarhizium album ARSEF 1941]|uniref:NIPSNAP family protein n=1 Tax=Metarhizium album (strain ARSEF 1941) TaxID=1081103 RepID=A0A0B2X4E0_METAS|nr:NIPSNAP family protein [Metarhizium album ARSEF 1941]KHO00275.1 NIPSNAP family protein [Metarhizium album ARSEF 1941]
MLSRSLPRRRVTADLHGVWRAFGTAAARQSKTPSMGDINPSRAQIDSFNRKQAQFREMLVEAQKEQGARALAANNFSASETSGQGSSETDAGVTAEASKHETDRKPNVLSNLIYGTKEGREMEAQIQASFSQVLARGKYVHSIVFHEVKPDRVDEYMALVGHYYPKIANLPENKVHLVGSWRVEIGDCDTFVHIWEYQKYEGYHQSRYSITHHPEFADFDSELKLLINSKHISLMQEFSFWPTTPPRQLGGIFELRSYTLHPGNLLEWEFHWRRGLEARREVMEGVGAWFVQIGELNTVHHLWQFANLEERRERREKSWSVEGWSDTVHKTVPLIQSMKSRILVPMPWSPVA